MSKRRFSAKFKTKVVLEALKERESMAELARKHELHVQQISKWKRDFLDKASGVFESGLKPKQDEAEEQKAALLKKIGELTIENDFLKKVLR
jgi:transposase